MKNIIPDPCASEREFNRFWNFDLAQRDDADVLQAELFLLRHEEAGILFNRADRLIWCGDCMHISSLDWLRGRQSAIQRHMPRIQRRAA